MEEHKKLIFKQYVRANENIRMMTEDIMGHHPEHSHDDFIEIAYIDAGSGVQTINGAGQPISEGDLFLFNPSIVHSFTSDPERPLRVINCIFQPEMLGLSPDSCQDFLDVAYRCLYYSLQEADDPRQFLRLSGLSDSEISRLLHEMAQEYRQRGNGFMQILKADLTKLLILIFRRCQSDARQKPDSKIYQKLIVQEAETYLSKHFREEITCPKLAQRAYLSVNYFRTVFREVTGETVIRKLQQIRIREACRLLTETDWSVAEIGASVGYRDTKFFTRLFRQQTGMTPGVWRKRMTGESPPKFD